MALRDPRTPSSNHGQPRSPDPTGSRSYGDPSSQATHFFHQLAKEQLIPQIANRTRNAIDVDRREVFYYQRLRSGRRCSCFDGGETTPQAGCPICFAWKSFRPSNKRRMVRSFEAPSKAFPWPWMRRPAL